MDTGSGWTAPCENLFGLSHRVSMLTTNWNDIRSKPPALPVFSGSPTTPSPHLKKKQHQTSCESPSVQAHVGTVEIVRHLPVGQSFGDGFVIREWEQSLD